MATAMLLRETVVEAAIRIDGRIFSDCNHGFCYNLARESGIDVDERFMDMEDGFVTSRGRFVSRRSAFRIARRSKQPMERTPHDARLGVLAEQFNDFCQ
jgi:hypothetical protein